MTRPIVIVGAGAAGLVAAITAAATPAVKVIVVEKTRDGGRKILISGGGRCNVLPVALQPERFVTASSPATLRRLLRSWPIDDQRAFFERDVGVELALEAESAKYFPRSNRARDVRDGLVALARRRGVEVVCESALTNLVAVESGWRVETMTGPIEAAAVVLATGGLSVPATGSDGMGLRLAAALGHIVHDTYPALTPLVADPAVHASLSGVSLTVRLRTKWQGKTRQAAGGFLFTHRGYSGPSVLDISDVAVRSKTETTRATIRAQWSALDATAWAREFASAGGRVTRVMARHVPERLAERLAYEAGLPSDRSVAELRRSERLALIERLTAYALPWSGDEGYAKAEVTGGGVALSECDPRTLESRRQRGLFLCGEMLDAFGPIGGHNFAWAWATGRLAGLGAAEKIRSRRP
jgi:hypothetical protein